MRRRRNYRVGLGSAVGAVATVGVLVAGCPSPHAERPSWPASRLPILVQTDDRGWVEPLEEAVAWWNTRGLGQLFSVVYTATPVDGAVGMVSATVGPRTEPGRIGETRISHRDGVILSAPVTLAQLGDLSSRKAAMSLARHELGHVLGLADVPRRGAVMYASAPGSQLSDASVQFLGERYQ